MGGLTVRVGKGWRRVKGGRKGGRVKDRNTWRIKGWRRVRGGKKGED